jgi:hypothetical protein
MQHAPAQPDPRVLAVISHALSHGVYSIPTQLALIRCFAGVFGETEWWQAMLHDEPEIAALVVAATSRTLH